MSGTNTLFLAVAAISLMAAVVMALLWAGSKTRAVAATEHSDALEAARTSEAARANDAVQLLAKAQAAYRALHTQATGKLAAANVAGRQWQERYQRLAHWEPIQNLKETGEQLREQNAELEARAARLRNLVEGYGTRYLVPPQTELDALAREAGHTTGGQGLKAARAATRELVRAKQAAKADCADPALSEAVAEFALDAFNGKVDGILAQVKSDNIGTLRQRMEDAYAQVNDLGKAFGSARIIRTYLNARIAELKWATQVHLLKEAQRDEQRQAKERMREEARVQRELERAQREAKKQEDALTRQRQLIEQEREQAIQEERARQEARLAEELSRVSEAQRAGFEAQLRVQLAGELAARTAQFEDQLAAQDAKIHELEEQRLRAKSMAEQTKRGTVYIISNVGAFGEGVYKIGLTRRLDPLERIDELGDASVPFDFDVHALVATEDAPALERELHEAFVINQVNKMNWRKEFFRVGLAEIREVIDTLGTEVEWTMEAAAQEYRETLALEERMADQPELKARWLAEQAGVDFTSEPTIASDEDRAVQD